MIGKLKRSLCFTLIAALTLSAMIFPASAFSENPYDFSDTKGHWAEEEIRLASCNRHTNGDRWVNGYPDGTFRPGAQVSRAEFVKMLAAATYLYPYTDTAKFLHEFSSYAKSGEMLTDMDGHWLTKEGWTQAALDFGLILPSDYPGGAFLPSQPATRLEAAVMIVRALGLVYPAQQSTQEELPFTDAAAIPQELRGYVFQAVKAGVLEGYPDNTFGGGKTITRAEAVAMIFRALDYMEQGIDREIKVFVTESSDYLPENEKQRIKLNLSVPAQVIDGTIYVSLRDIFASYFELYRDGGGISKMIWDVEQQQLTMDSLVYILMAGAGDVRYEYSPYTTELSQWSKKFPLPARMLYGSLMVPVYTSDTPSITDIWWNTQWDEMTKILVLPLVPMITPNS